MSRIEENHVIDNRKVVLKDELLNILSASKKANIAVGYLFISGLEVIIEPLLKVDKVRLLISNTTDKKTGEALLEIFNSKRTTCEKINEDNYVNLDSAKAIIADVGQNVKRTLERMEQTISDKRTVDILIEMIKRSQLEVRIYPKEKLHAKAYIFELRNPGVVGGVGIVGSSNLSMSGIYQNSELNLKTSNPGDVNKLLEWFDELWQEGLEFTNDFNIILSQSWAGRTYSPRELFLKAIYHESKIRFDPSSGISSSVLVKGPTLYDFQRLAVEQCLNMIDHYGGVIVGDVVGLGKTYVGIAILKYLSLTQGRPLIICPPALQSMWNEFCENYEVDALVLSRGKLQNKTNELTKFKYKSRNVVLIDESHRFKNSHPNQYQNLHQFMQERKAKAILLTATPYSNKPDDIKNQLMLFHLSEKTRIPPANETDLNRYFNLVKRKEADLPDLLRNIMIRRTRRYILAQWGQKDENDPTRRYLLIDKKRNYFPQRLMHTLTYDIDRVYHGQYEAIVSKLDETHLTLARYSPGRYLKDDFNDIDPYKDLYKSGTELVRLIRSLLLKRMESSFQAFSDSIKLYINTHKIFAAALRDNVVPIGDLSVKEMYDAADQELDRIDDKEELQKIISKIKEKKESKYVPEAFKMEALICAVEQDLETFEAIWEMIKNITHKTDDKLVKLQKFLDTQCHNKQVIIFTEFASTARYIRDHISWKDKDSVELVTSEKNPISAARRFDPEHNPPHLLLEPSTTLLITTDVLSEGVNLQAGETVINFDFHWNPIRLIQRVGRVDRIGSKHDFISVCNFLPDPTIEKDLGIEKSVDAKISEIQRVIGEDYPVLKEDEKINEQDLYAIYHGNDEILDKDDDESSLSIKFDHILTYMREHDPKQWEELRHRPYGIRSSSTTKKGKLLIVCEGRTIKSGTVTIHYLVHSTTKIERIESLRALHIMEQAQDKTGSLPDNYDEFVKVGWQQFLKDIKQIQTSDNPGFNSKAQRNVMHKLMLIARKPGTRSKFKILDKLLESFAASIPKGSLQSTIAKIDLNSNDDEFIDTLTDIYYRFGLQDNASPDNQKFGVPRILYSEYVSDDIV